MSLYQELRVYQFCDSF